VCEARCEILTAHGAGISEHADKQIQCCHTPIIGFATEPIMIEGGSPNQMVFNWERGHGDVRY